MLKLEEKKRSGIPTPFPLFARGLLDTEVCGRFNHNASIVFCKNQIVVRNLRIVAQ